MSDEFLKELTKLIYGDPEYKPNNPFFDILVDLIEEELERQWAEAVKRFSEEPSLNELFLGPKYKRKGDGTKAEDV